MTNPRIGLDMPADPDARLQPKDALTESDLSRMRAIWNEIRAQLGKAVVGQDELIEQLVIAILSRGHCLLVGMPGVAKSLTASSLARVLGLDFHRIRCTPDLTPEDLTDSAASVSSAASFEKGLSGLLFANLLLVDDIDRLPPRTSSVLQQAIQDREVVVRGQRRQLPNPFLLLATRYPAEEESPEAAAEPREDRFLFEIRARYPSYEAEYRMAETTTAAEEPQLEQVLSAAEILVLQQQVRRVAAPPPALHFAIRLVRSTRVHEGENPDFVYEWVSRGAGPRAARALILAAKVRAALRGRAALEIGDLRAVAHPVLRHRVITNRNARSNGIHADRVISRLLEEIPQRLEGDDASSAAGTVTDPQQWFPADVLQRLGR